MDNGQSPTIPKKSGSPILSLIQALKNQEPVLKTLQELRNECRGNVPFKLQVFTSLGDQLLTWLSHPDQDLQLETAMLLRMLTTCREVKLSDKFIAVLTDKLKEDSTNNLKIALAAVIRNLTVSVRQRIALVNADALSVLASNLLTTDDTVLKEVAGALRNLSLDENQQEEFASSAIVDGLTHALTTTEDEDNLECICSILSNISLGHQTRKLLITEALVAGLTKVLMSGPPSKILLFALSTFVNLAIDGKNGILQTHFTSELVERLLVSRLPRVKEAIYAILDFLCQEHSEDVTSSTSEDLSLEAKADSIPKEKKEIEPQQSTQDVLRQLNLEESIKPEDLTFTKKIGEGQYGDVWMGLYHNYPVAIKVIKKEMTSQDAHKALDELKFMSKLKHPNVVLLMGACCNENNQVMIVTEFAARGDLRGCISGPSLRSLSMRLTIGLDIASGLSWLASHGIVHRDLKLPNLLVFDDWTVKVGDFGLSLQLKEGQIVDRFGGNVKYSAPEILRARYNDTQCEYAYSEKTDVYSFGLMLWELISLKPLFVRPKGYAGKKGLAKYVLDGFRPPLDKPWVPSLKKLLTDCWHEDPTQRPLFRDIISQWPVLTNDVLCPDPNGMAALKRLWGKDDNGVTVDEFRKTFGDCCLDGPTALDMRKHAQFNQLLTAILCENESDDIVSKKRFCAMIGWFGPVDKHNGCRDFSARIKDLTSQKFFHGFMTEKKAANCLTKIWQTKRQQCYLVRFSESDVGFVLSFLEEGIVRHENISNRSGNWYLESFGEEFSSWKKVITSSKNFFKLKKHLPGSPFAKFHKKR